MSVTSAFHRLREDLALEAAHYHAGAQVGRFLAVFAGALGLQLATGGSIAGWSDLRAAFLATLPVAYRQWRKTMPVQAAQRTVNEHEAAITQAVEPPAAAR